MFAQDFWESAAMSSNAQRFAVAVLDGFKAAGHYTDDEIGEAGGPSTTTLTKLRKVAADGGDMPPPRGDTLRKIDRAAGWMPGSARALWQTGADPKPNTSSERMREILGQPPLTAEQLRKQRRWSAGAASPEAYVDRLADRLLEVEERLDILEQELGRTPDMSEANDTLPAAAKEGQLEGPGETDI